MRHRVRRSWQAWADIGAGRKVVDMIPNGLLHDLKWRAAVPAHINGRSIYKPDETVYMHVDSSGYGWVAILNDITEVRGF
eukprot:jgi/Tetstr1/466734/TSEL_011207.t1